MRNIDAPFTVHGTPNRVAEAIFVTIMGCKEKAAARDATYIEWWCRHDRVICSHQENLESAFVRLCTIYALPSEPERFHQNTFSQMRFG
jgi:hypothetical protein